MKNYLMVLLLLLTGAFSQVVEAGEVSTDLNFQVDGKATILKNDVAQAREEAVKNALEKAILQTAAKLLADKYEDEKFQSVKSILIGKADLYVKNYRIISETSHQDDYTASVNVMVAQAFVRNDLILMGLLQNSETPVQTSVSVVLKGMKKSSDFTRLKQFLHSRTIIVKSVFPCTMEWQQAQCDLLIAGEMQTLISELERSGRYVVDVPGKKQEGFELNLRMKEED
jgi:hypothetical protein